MLRYISLFGAFLFFVISINAHVVLDYPVGGETFLAGTTVRIQWHPDPPHETEHWDLLYSFDNGSTWDTLQANIHVDSLGFDWMVPDSASSDVLIRVVQDNVGTDYDDQSDAFSIIVIMMWLGDQDDQWDNPQNWLGASIPSADSPIEIPAGGTNYPNILATEEGFGATLIVVNGARIVVDNGGQLSIGGN